MRSTKAATTPSLSFSLTPSFSVHFRSVSLRLEHSDSVCRIARGQPVTIFFVQRPTSIGTATFSKPASPPTNGEAGRCSLNTYSCSLNTYRGVPSNRELRIQGIYDTTRPHKAMNTSPCAGGGVTCSWGIPLPQATAPRPPASPYSMRSSKPPCAVSGPPMMMACAT